MGKIDELKEIKSDLKEMFKALLYAMLGMLTGVITIVYKILVGTVPAHIVLFGGLGLVVMFLISIYALKISNTMQEINREMRDVN